MKGKTVLLFSLLKALLLFTSLLLSMPSSAHPEVPTWSGSFRSLDIYGKQAPADVFPDYRLSSNRLRLDSAWRPTNGWRFEASLDYQFLWSDPADVFSLHDKDYNRCLDLKKTSRHGGHGASLLQVDRLNLQWRKGAMDMVLGRQAIGFGRILIYSPLDVIAPFPPDAIDTEVRSGVDALHAIYNYGLDGQLGAITVWGDEPEYNSYLATWSDNRYGLDLLMIGGQLRGHNMFGAGIAGSLGTLGLKTEVSVHDGRKTDQPGGDLHESYVIAAFETWYRFDNGISLISQYLYNGAGADQPEDYLEALNSTPIEEGLTALLGRHYLIVAPSYEIHPLATAQGLLLYNLQDGSALIRPTLDLSLADNISLQLFWTWNLGRKPTASSAFLPAEPRSEFGMRGDSGGLFLTCFF